MKKWICLFLGIAAVLLCVGVSAEEPLYCLSYVQEVNGPAMPSTSVIKAPDPSFTGNWTFPYNGIRASRQKVDKVGVIQLNPRSTYESDAIVLTYNEEQSLAKWDVLAIPLYISGEVEGAYSAFRVSVELTLDNGTVAYTSAWLDGDGWQRLVMDVSDLTHFASMTLSVHTEAGKIPKMVRVAPMYLAGSERYDHIDRYLTHVFELSTGRLTSSGETVTVAPFGGATNLEGRFALRTPPRDGTQAFMLVTLSGEITNGTVTLGLRTADSQGGGYSDSAAVKLQNGRYVYSFPFTARENMISYRLSFRNVVFAGEGICVESVSIVWTDDYPDRISGLGYLSGISVNRTNGRLTVSGSLSQSVMSDYRKDSLVLYAVPYSASAVGENGAWEGTELLRSKLYRNFELVLDAEVTSRYLGTHMFYVAIEGEGHEPILLSSPKGVDSVEHVPEEKSVLGLVGASAVGLFESNASHVIVELPFHRLILGTERSASPADELTKASETGSAEETASDLAVASLGRAGELPIYSGDTVKVTAPDGTVILMDHGYLEELLAEIGFYRSADMDVYLRITSGPAPFADSVSALSAWDLEIFSAALSYIFQMDSKVMEDAVAGVILGDAVSYDSAFFAERSPYAFTAKLSALMRTAYSTMVQHAEPSSVSVIVPFGAGGVYNGMVNQMLSVHLKRMGEIPWYMMFDFSYRDQGEMDKFGAVLKEAEATVQATRQLGMEGDSVGMIYSYEPDLTLPATGITLEYNRLCEKTAEYAPRAVFLSVSALTDGRKVQLYGELKKILSENKNSKIESIAPKMDEEGSPAVGYTVWDFSNQYYNDGWVSGGAVSGCATGRSEIFSRESGVSLRALRAKVFSTFENTMASTIVLRNFDRAVDLSGVDELVFRFSVAETADPSAVTFIVGNESLRGEFALTEVSPGVVHTVRCPLSAYSGLGRVAYLGVMIYSGEGAVLEIQSVELRSAALTSEEMAGRFLPPAETPEEKSGAIYLALGLIGVLTVFAAVVMIRRDREETEQKGVPLPEKKGTGRGYLKNG